MDGRENLKAYLPGSTAGELRRDDGRDEADSDLIAAELDYIAAMKGDAAKHIADLRDAVKENRPAGDRAYLFGLALSGGGIRSATFSLGVMQRLARAKILQHVDYLSTVSGGGYIGAALSWWMSGKTGSKEHYDLGAGFPYGTNDPKNADQENNRLLAYLRRNGKYLIPGGGITIWSGAAVVLRAVLLNLLVWIPIVAFLFLLLRWLGTLPFLNGLSSMVGMLVPGALPGLAQAVSPASGITVEAMLPPVFLLCLLLAALLVALFLVSAVNYSLLSWMGRGESSGRQPEEERQAGLGDSGFKRDSVTGQGAGTSVLRQTARWILAGLLSLADLAILILLIQRLGEISPAMFGDQDPATLAGGLASRWRWGLAVLAIAGVIFLFATLRDRLLWNQRKRFVRVFIAFVGLFAADAVLELWLHLGWPPDFLWGHIKLGWIAGLINIVALVGFFVFANFWVAYGIRWLLRTEGLSVRYGGRRLFEQVFGFVLVAVIGLLVLGTIPIIVAWAQDRYPGLQGAASIVAGVASTFWGYLRTQQKSTAGSGGTKLALTAGAILFLYGLALVGYVIAVSFETGEPMLRMALTGLFIVALLTGWFANVNYIALHRFYRDRLTEAFLPDSESVEEGKVGPARRADSLRITELWSKASSPCEPAKPRGPYHIVNTNLVLVNSPTRKYRLRGGDNFIISPLYSGSAATGWQRSDTHMDGEMTLASAMATSGAAANPRSGPGGQGITRNRFVSLVMTLLNFRLGYWTTRPSGQQTFLERANAYLKLPKQKDRANHFWPSGLYAIFNSGNRETSTMVELSDGGHFENLAIYELIRRRCALIILCDGGQDVEASYADFVTAIERIGQDFGATVSFDMEIDSGSGFKASGPEALIARKKDSHYPKKAEYADKGYFLASIDYGHRGDGPWPRKGTIIYMKTTMIPELSMTAKGYKGANPDFPDQTTADQFFEEEQFEAYREVGYRIAEQMIGDLDLETLFQARPARVSLVSNARFRRRP